MPMISEADRIAEFKNLMDFLLIIDAPAKIMTKEADPYLLVALPTIDDMWEPQEMTEDGHFAFLRIEQLFGKNTKYLVFETRIRFDCHGAPAEQKLLNVVNEINSKIMIGSLSVIREGSAAVVQYRYALGTTAGENFPEASVCEAILEMGRTYDCIKASGMRVNRLCCAV